ncbi:carbamate kinase [Neobacillus sp. OS1-32]|uniref:carbamate kinase n=1 Tax=Neobacillus sp. OS1-32 TaxID=3070682 RepID=UPI0027E121BD|nr:carbamate kinase [Neobacillus sp. OS1-32]WML29875.1 carbamate kinase [Neobacillus sp. OS1-32]
MPRQKLVIALGGNALGNSPQEQLKLVKETAKTIASFAKEDFDIIIGHGNGPQVGMINLAFDVASLSDNMIPPMPFPECGAMSQAYIGYHLQQAIQNELAAQHINRTVCTLVTQVVVDEGDQAFKKPSKPVGIFYSREQAEKLAQEKGFKFVEDAGRGYRRVVPSPLPRKIVEMDLIKELASKGEIVITVGGGGIPVIEDENGYHGVAAVIDKDRSTAKVAIDVHADLFLILTAVDQVYINFNSPNQKGLSFISLKEAKDYIMEGQFAKGSMLPKIEACLSYLEACPSGQAMITSLEHAPAALAGKTGTVLTV